MKKSEQAEILGVRIEDLHNYDLSFRDVGFDYIFRMAIEEEIYRIVELCLRSGMKRFYSSDEPHELDFHLHYAVKSNNIQITNLLLESGIFDINFFGRYSETPIFRVQSKEMARYLIDKGANIHTMVYDAENKFSKLGYNVLMYIATAKAAYISYLKRKEIVQCLLENKAEVNARNINNDTILHILISNKLLSSEQKREMIEIMLEHGADVNVQNNQGHTPLSLAAQPEDLDIMRTLADYGASLEKAKHIEDVLNAKIKKIYDKFMDYTLSINERSIKELELFFKFKGIPDWINFLPEITNDVAILEWLKGLKQKIEQGKNELNKLIFPDIAGILHTKDSEKFPTPCPQESFNTELAQNDTEESKEKYRTATASYKELPKYLHPDTLLEDLDKGNNFNEFMKFITIHPLPFKSLAKGLEKVIYQNFFLQPHRDNIMRVIEKFKRIPIYLLENNFELTNQVKELQNTLAEEQNMDLEERTRQQEKRKLEESAKGCKRMTDFYKKAKYESFAEQEEKRREKGKEKAEGYPVRTNL